LFSTGDIVDLNDGNFGWRGKYIVMTKKVETPLIKIKNLGTGSQQFVRAESLRKSKCAQFFLGLWPGKVWLCKVLLQTGLRAPFFCIVFSWAASPPSVFAMIKTNRRDAALNVAAGAAFLLLAAFIHSPEKDNAQALKGCVQAHPDRYCRLTYFPSSRNWQKLVSLPLFFSTNAEMIMFSKKDSPWLF
jgi:hypothetical protein